ncbi:hypothetical protein [Streptomyces scabiei]|uniref:hypothetical protein n=1 Tax=Streptomyces scabiei TaxID=1930 RepID=UPI001B31B880|nr:MULTISPECIES: hypothetical protein [Streptomyces]MBP5891291.1 hypothetical protein [Streptomyces sp. LBUM 1481]MBP5921446.1 hypothetical protein [Streptomyces sp. LBUM 1483]MDX2691344.1 hypothetical protein [Streptomyces scabiei]MDX2756409.1 hypothetical protein [Streptomyces scabiei]MDX2810472.1 hypothetical protein [Streptomyces scabiei]
MEQRIGSNNQPLAAAAVDPSHIPGLTAPVAVTKEKQEEPEDIKPTEPVEPDEAAPERNEPAAAEAPKPSLDKAPDKAPDAEPAADAAAAEDAEDTQDAADDADDADEADGTVEPADGPVFEAADRRASITADSRGVRLRLDDQECDFGWDEIGAIETESPRFGKRFTITVHTPDRRWYFLEIEAKAKSEHAVWEKQIDEVLDAYFDDEADHGDEGDRASDEAESTETEESADSVDSTP